MLVNTQQALFTSQGDRKEKDTDDCGTNVEYTKRLSNYETDKLYKNSSESLAEKVHEQLYHGNK